MIYIAHRALFDGYDDARENHPDQVKLAFENLFYCEIDVRFVDGKWALGHDEPVHEVSQDFILQSGLWLHCKNVEALERLAYLRFFKQTNYFWHQQDDQVLTSQGYFWTYPGKRVSKTRGIHVLPEWSEGWLDHLDALNGYGICSKFVRKIRSLKMGLTL